MGAVRHRNPSTRDKREIRTRDTDEGPICFGKRKLRGRRRSTKCRPLAIAFMESAPMLDAENYAAQG